MRCIGRSWTTRENANNHLSAHSQNHEMPSCSCAFQITSVMTDASDRIVKERNNLVSSLVNNASIISASPKRPFDLTPSEHTKNHCSMLVRGNNVSGLWSATLPNKRSRLRCTRICLVRGIKQGRRGRSVVLQREKCGVKLSAKHDMRS